MRITDSSTRDTYSFKQPFKRRELASFREKLDEVLVGAANPSVAYANTLSALRTRLSELELELSQIRTVAIDRPGKGRTLGLFVGVDDYRNVNLPSLRYASNDATAMARAFQRQERDVSRILLNEAATRAAILKSVAELGSEARSEDKLVIYFSGMGMEEGPNQSFVFIPFDGDVGRTLASGVTFSDLNDALASSRAAEKLILLDSCYSGNDVKAFLTQRDPEARRGVLTAGQSGQSAYEDAELGHGVFTYHLLKALQNQASSGQSVNIEELSRHVQTEVSAASRNRQSPAFFVSGPATESRQ